MRVAIYVMHVPGIPSREAALAKLIERAPRAVVMADPERKGAWWNAERCWQHGVSMVVDWVVVLNDDALPCPDFEAELERALASVPADGPVCLYAGADEMHKPWKAGCDWAVSLDGLVGVGCAMTTSDARDFLAWLHTADVGSYSDDGRINLWALATGRRIATTLPSLVDHQLPNESTVTWSADHGRSAVARWSAVDAGKRWSRNHEFVGRVRSGQHWEMMFRTPLSVDTVERGYSAERHGAPVSLSPHVFIAMPAARAPELAIRISVQRVVEDLESNGIQATFFESPGDSLVTRGRHGLCHEFLRSTATHFLQWDDDVECLDATAVRRMVETGFDVVGGAYPWRDGSGRVVANPLTNDAVSGKVDVSSSKCIKVAEVGTGFLMVSRKCLVDLCVKHPELMYMADIEPYVGAPMWALFDAHLEPRAELGGRKRYASEDWRFCSIARAAGYDVMVYYPPVFRHWGKHPHAGHILHSWGMNKPHAVKEATE